MANWKAKAQKSGSGSAVDWDYVNSQVKTGLVGGRISAIVDFGIQAGESMIDEKSDTYFESEEEADKFIDSLLEHEHLERSVRELKMEDFDAYDELFKLPFKIVKDKWVLPESQRKDNVSYFKREKYAQAEYDRAVELIEEKILQGGKKAEYGAKELAYIKKAGIEKKHNMVKVSGALFEPSPANEVGVWADSTENLIEYVEGSGEKRPFRSELFGNFKGNVSGLKLIEDRSTGCLKNKKLLEIITACDQNTILKQGHDDQGDISLLVGTPLKLNMIDTDGFIKVKGLIKCEANDNIPELPEEPICVGFEDEPEEIVEKFKRFFLRDVIVDKIKMASNYKGSNMELAIELWKGGSEGEAATTTADAADSPKLESKDKANTHEEIPDTDPSDEDLDPFGDDDVPY